MINLFSIKKRDIHLDLVATALPIKMNNIEVYSYVYNEGDVNNVPYVEILCTGKSFVELKHRSPFILYKKNLF